MKTVALVTYNKQPNLTDGDKLLIEPFLNHGFIPKAIPWDKKSVLWENFDLVILRSCWNYHLRVPEFLDWVIKLESRKVNLWNPPSIIRWNINKKYLLELEKKGIPIVSLIVINKEDKYYIEDILNKKGWKDIIIKPTIGASAYGISRIGKDNFKKSHKLINKLLETTPQIIIQPFIREIQLEGEYSFIFIGDKYSHTILKKPKGDEFRVNYSFGGIWTKVTPNKDFIRQAQKIHDMIDSPLLYARIDAINIKGELQLMELELIEPYLFFEKDEKSAEEFVEATISLSRKPNEELHSLNSLYSK